MNKPRQLACTRDLSEKQEKVANDRSHLFGQLAYMSNLSNMNINVNNAVKEPIQCHSYTKNFSSYNRRRKMCHLSTNFKKKIVSFLSKRKSLVDSQNI